MLSLDEVDVKLINILIRNSRTSISEIAKELGLSRPTIRKGIKRLVDSGVIEGFTIVVNKDMLRGFQAMCSFRTKSVEDIAERLRRLRKVNRHSRHHG